MNRPVKVFKTLVQSIWNINAKFYLGFVYGHHYINESQVDAIKHMVFEPCEDIVSSYEESFAKIVGDGAAISYAAGRMGFFELLKITNVGPGDEVVLLGSTCAVVAEAVLRTGATPVYSDIDEETFGSCLDSIKNCTTPKTKMIVAQHSFGIPCDIDGIAAFAASRKIFLLEDCALTVGSRINGKIVGNFGDAAIFSTDHTKPINTMIGGIVYTRNRKLESQLRQRHTNLPNLSISRQLALHRRFLIERHYCLPSRYPKFRLVEILESLRKKIGLIGQDFLIGGFPANEKVTFPYPAKMPPFLAAIGLLEISRWPKTEKNRKALLRELIKLAEKNKFSTSLPKSYFDEKKDIVPLRFVWSEVGGPDLRVLLSSIIETSSTWFLQPIISTRTPLSVFEYRAGDSLKSETKGPLMINIPCNLPMGSAPLLLQHLSRLTDPDFHQ